MEETKVVRTDTKCEHNKEKSRCRLCNGSQFCIHDKNKQYCKLCHGTQICVHNNFKQDCKLCRGSQICHHNKQKKYCVLCHGSQVCIHNKNKQYCKLCGGSAYCLHDKQKRYCRLCGGSSYCSHGKEKRYCDLCNGAQLCIHSKQKQYCKPCGGSTFCGHDKNKKFCKICDGSKLCKNEWCEISGNRKYEGYCLTCFIHLFPDKPNTRNYKTKEKDVVDRITQTFTEFTWVADKKVQDGCSRRRPDLLLDMGSHIIIVEIDENKHTDYDCSCEHKRLMELSQDLQHRPIVFVRFNPDDYTNQNGILVKSCWKLNKLGVMTIPRNKQKEWEERIDCLKQQIQYWIDNPIEKTIEIVELFY